MRQFRVLLCLLTMVFLLASCVEPDPFSSERVVSTTYVYSAAYPYAYPYAYSYYPRGYYPRYYWAAGCHWRGYTMDGCYDHRFYRGGAYRWHR